MRLARLWGRGDGDGGESPVVAPSPGPALLDDWAGDPVSGEAASWVTTKLQLTVWEQWM